MQTDRCVYITYNNKNDVELVTVALYTFVKNLLQPTDHIYIIYKQEIEDFDKNILLKLHPVKFITPGKQVKDTLSSYTNHLDITGKIFSKINSDKTAVVVYVYYYEHWQEIYNNVKRLSEYEPVDVYVYLSNTCSSKHAAHIMNCEQNNRLKIFLSWTKNNGRDVRSFLMFIKNKHYLSYSKICKIHTKKTTYLDQNWRSNYLNDLLSPEHVEDHWYKLKHGHRVSSLDRYIIHEKHVATNTNYKNMCKLIDITGMKLKPHDRYTFHAGTMFWCTREMCELIDSLIDGNHLEEFEQEPIGNDCTLAHAWERMFSLL